MKNLLKLLAIIPISAFILSCSDDEQENPSKVVVQFADEGLTIPENSNEKKITIEFNRVASQSGRIQIALDAEHAKYLNTIPAAVNGVLSLYVEKNVSSASFTLKPENDFAVNASKQVEFTLKEVLGNFLVGNQNKFTLTIQDDESTSPLSFVNFIPVNATIKETNADGYTLQLHVSESAGADGQIFITSHSEKAIYGQHYITEPAFENGRLSLTAIPGTSVVSFKVIPVDNGTVNGEYQIDFNIDQTEGNIQKGNKVKEVFKITDDELENKPKGYEIAAGNWGLKRTIEYDALGRIYKVHIESATPVKSIRTETYLYNATGELEKIYKYPNIVEVFTWESSRIIKSEYINYGELKSYTEYDYDDFGNVSATATYYKQPDGQFKLGTLLGYLYFTDGNLYKALTYVPAPNGEEPILLSTRTYDGYIDAVNPFPMVDILPTVKTQTKLPSTYRVEENGVDLVYDLSYEFRTDGLVGKRRATSKQATETAVYLYY